MLMLSSMIDYSSAMENALLTKLNMIMFFCFFFVFVLFLFFFCFFNNSIYLHRNIICYITY